MAVDVLVVGAGPTGLTAALDLQRFGLSVRIVDQKPGPSPLSKALVLHSRTMEAFAALGVAEAIDRESLPFVALNLRPLPFLPPIRVDLAGGAWGDARYPGWRSLGQDRTEAVLRDALLSRGLPVDWNTALVSADVREDGVVATLDCDGGTEQVHARWLLGCDGGRGKVRTLAGIDVSGRELGAHFLLADVRTSAAIPDDEGQVILAREGVLLIVPMPEPGCFRLILHADPAHGEPTDPAWYDALIRRRAGLDFGSSDVSWVSLFRLRDALASRLRVGPIFVLGDAAHLQSPVGGQGLNTGVQDAHNLAWKLAHVHRGWADAMLLDSFQEERLPIARGVVRMTSLATRVLTTRVFPLWAVRGLVSSLVLRLPMLQRRFGAALGMPTHRYRPGIAIGSGWAGPIRSGCRLPDLPLGDGRGFHDLLHPHRRTVLGPAPVGMGSDHEAEVPVERWHELGLARAEHVVVRPDRVVQSVR